MIAVYNRLRRANTAIRERRFAEALPVLRQVLAQNSRDAFALVSLGGAYVALDNHRNNDYKPYLFKTSDYGRTWTNVTGNLPQNGEINALREDYDNPDLLFHFDRLELQENVEIIEQGYRFAQWRLSVKESPIVTRVMARFAANFDRSLCNPFASSERAIGSDGSCFSSAT